MKKLFASSAVVIALILALPTSALAVREVDPKPAATVDVRVAVGPENRETRVNVEIEFQPPPVSDRGSHPPDPDLPTDTVDIDFTEPPEPD